MHLFYTPDINSDSYTLSEEESKHAIRVLRLQKGDIVHLVDGRGTFFQAAIADAHPKKTRLEVRHKTPEYKKRNHHLHIALAPTKNIDRVEWFLEKATEIGIDEISPIICERSERRELRVDRLNKIITAAMKQSQKAYHPRLNEAKSFSAFLKSATATQKFIAHCAEGEKSEIPSLLQAHSAYLVLIGPEGDFSPDELAQAFETGYQPVTLGDSRLRTETAALEACFEINFLNR